MVKLTNKGGDFKQGRQGPAVYQGFYGKGMRRTLKPKKNNTSQKQIQVQERFKEGLTFAESLSDIEKQTIIGFIKLHGLKLTWHNYAKLVSMAPVKVDRAGMQILASISFPSSMQAWKCRNKISVTEYSGVPKTNFPVLIELQGNNISAPHYVDFSLLKPGGDDLRFSKDDGETGIIYGIENWNSSAKTAKVWIRMDSIPASQTVYVFMYYKNPGAVPASNLPSALYG
jgi:hypothetical protein